MRRLLSCLGALDTILGTAAATFFNTHTVKGAADNVVTHTGKVFYTTTTDEHDTVLL